MKKTIQLIGILLFMFCIIGTGCKKHKHSFVHVNQKEATCMEAGTVEYWKCKTCGKYFLDEEGKIETQDVVNQKKLEHTYSDWIIDEYSTCSTEGKKHKECKVCRKVLEEENLAKEEHMWIDATCTVPKTCKMCEKTEGIPLGHIYDTSNIKWEWSDNFDEAIAILICKNDETHQERINATVVSKDKVHTATIVYNNVEYSNKVVASKGLKYALNYEQTYYTVEKIGTCTDTDIVIPSEYKGLPVIRIGRFAFKECSGLISIALPNGLTSIENSAFENCSNLKNITIPNSVTSMGSYAFSGCSSLTSITIPNGLTSIVWNAFSGCSSLKSITIPNSVTSIENSAFSGCKSLRSITIPNSVTSIENSAFYDCISLTSVNIPSSVTKIQYNTFSGCKSLTSIMIPNGVTSIGDSAFYGCKSLITITLPNSITSIGDSAFDNCEKLTNINIPDSITSIGNFAFSSCYDLQYNEYGNCYYLGNDNNPYLVLVKANDDTITAATIHRKTKIICRNAFGYCYRLTSVSFMNTDGWFITSEYENITGASIDVTDDTINATNLTSDFDDYFWKNL